MKENVDNTSSMPNLTDTRWWALKLEGIYQGIINAEADRGQYLFDGKKNSFSEVWESQKGAFFDDYESNKEINKKIAMVEQREKDLAEYYYHKKDPDDFERWSENNPKKKQYGDMIDGQNIKDVALHVMGVPDKPSKEEGLVMLGIGGLVLMLIVQILK